MKLELKHIAPYLPCGLDAINKDNKQMAIMGCLDEQTVVVVNNGCLRGYDLKYVKPILRPLSSMINDEAKALMLLCLDYLENVKVSIKNGLVIIHGFSFYDYWHLVELTIDTKTGYINIEHDEDTTVKTIGYEIYEWLFKHHFDVFNLIDNNLAIDKTAK